MMPVILTTPDLFKIKIFLNKGYGVIISIHDATNKILSSSSNYLVEVAICAGELSELFTLLPSLAPEKNIRVKDKEN